MPSKRAKIGAPSRNPMPPMPSRSSAYSQQQPLPTKNVSYVDDDDDENFLKPIKITYLNEDGTEVGGKYSVKNAPRSRRG